MMDTTLTRAEIIEKLSRRTPLSKQSSSHLLEEVLTCICQGLNNERSVGIVRFGTFRVLEKNTRIGRNPKTGEKAEISARKVVSFKPSPLLRERVSKNSRQHDD